MPNLIRLLELLINRHFRRVNDMNLVQVVPAYWHRCHKFKEAILIPMDISKKPSYEERGLIVPLFQTRPLFGCTHP